MPLLVAPVAFQRVAHPDGEVAMARAALAADTIMCYSTIATSTPAEVAETGVNRWFQLYVFSDEGITRHLIAQARDLGYRALVLTIDSPVRGIRHRDARTGFTIPPDMTIASLGRGGMTPAQVFDLVSPSLTWHDLERIAGEAGLPLLVKGVLTAEDAKLACEHGAAGIVVSNHGGRALDGVSATIDALPEVVAGVDGASRCSSTAASAAAATSSRRSPSARAQCSPGAARSGASRSTARRVPGTCSSCSAPRS